MGSYCIENLSLGRLELHIEYCIYMFIILIYKLNIKPHKNIESACLYYMYPVCQVIGSTVFGATNLQHE